MQKIIWRFSLKNKDKTKTLYGFNVSLKKFVEIHDRHLIALYKWSFSSSVFFKYFFLKNNPNSNPNKILKKSAEYLNLKHFE